jgi:hypothetical protein
MPEGKVYRLPIHYLAVGLGVGALFLAGIVGGVVGQIWEPSPTRAPRDPILVGAIYFGIGGFFVFVSLCLVLAYFRWRLQIMDGQVRSQGILSIQEMELATVDRAVWRTRPAGGGSLVLRSMGRKLTVPLASYSGGDRRKLVEYFHGVLPAERQDGWDSFEQRCCPWRCPGGYGPPGSWRSLVPITAAFLLIGIGSLVLAPFVPRKLLGSLLVLGVVNLAGGSYFARTIQRQRRAERGVL